MESAARMNQNKTVVPHLPFHSSPNGDTIIIHYSFFIIHLLFSIFMRLAWAPAKPRAQTRTDKPINHCSVPIPFIHAFGVIFARERIDINRQGIV